MPPRKAQPSDYIRLMACGLSARDRACRYFAMLQCNVDESQDGGAFVFGGYVATAESWAAFSDEWSAAMERIFKGERFSMREANADWSEELQRQNIGYLYDIIQQHVSLGIALAVNPADLQSAMAPIPDDRWQNPYYFLLYRLVQLVTDHPLTEGHQIEFVFDEGRQSEKILSSWDTFMARAPEGARSRVIGRPQFRDDRYWMPLQAADLKSRWARQRFNEIFHGAQPKRSMRNLREHLDKVPGISVNFSRDI